MCGGAPSYTGYEGIHYCAQVSCNELAANESCNHLATEGYGVATLAQNKIFYPINQELLLL
jgi:hypothetical protein